MTSDGAGLISLKGVSLRFGGKTDHLALKDIDLDIPARAFVALVGPSGSGKTTILNLIAGLLRQTAGTVHLRGRPVNGPDKAIGYMLARDALFPWRTAAKNVELHLESRGVPARERRERARSLLDQLGLGSFANAHRHQLSQGMRQRVALARTFAHDPEILLMDEPFATLDAQTRLRIQEWFTNIWESAPNPPTVVFVTHDLEEALLLSDRVVVLSSAPGVIVTDRAVSLPRPRGHLVDVMRSEQFRMLHHELWADLERASSGTNVVGVDGAHSHHSPARLVGEPADVEEVLRTHA